MRMQSVGLPPWRESLSGAVMRGYFKENNHRGFGSPSSVTHGFTARGTFPAAGEGSGWRQPKGFPLAGQEAPGKSQMLGFFSRVPDALAASGSYQTTDEGTLSMVSRAGKPTLRQSLRLFSLRSKCRLPLHKGGMVGCARLPCAKGAVGGSRLRDRLLGTKSSGSHEVTSLFYFEASIDAIIDSSTSISTFPKTI